ncbi:DUF2812 domain-containing protein [Bacillus sp. 2205SS5-2]|uniref:DUF2812 domain-containing protein n=1 Tax=Bacillus sp. 2205SS5-2 TaxID=3109031 RepID=UPI003003DA7E
MKKVVKPLWSYDVQKTEAWLSEMAARGFHFVMLNRWTRSFYFRPSERKSITYRISYEKVKGVSLSSSLQEEGWIKLVQSGNWLFLANEQPTEKIKTSSVREGVIKRNRMNMYIFSGVSIYLGGILVTNLLIWGIGKTQEGSVKVVESPLWVITYFALGLAIAVFILSIYSIIKINKNNKQLSQMKSSDSHFHSTIGKKFDKKTEKQMKRSGELVLIRKIGWMYSPDKLELWLESMEKKGLNLYRVSKTGTAFIFKKGKPRYISYCADYQNISNESYFNIHRDFGWTLTFSSYSALQKWTIWSKPYEEGEEKPQIYSDNTTQMKHAKKVAVAYTILFLPISLMCSFNVFLFLEGMIKGTSSTLNVVNFIMFFLLIFVFGSFIVRTWIYVWRLKKRLTLHP